MSGLFCRTTKGDVFQVWSDNTEEKTVNVYPLDEVFDMHSTVTDEIPYSDIAKMSGDVNQL